MIKEKVITFSPRYVQKTKQRSTFGWRGKKHGDLVLVRYFNLKIGKVYRNLMCALNKISSGEFVTDKNKAA